ncbi:hypothetical protein NSK_000604 [Nannochloropsis salina CCMP1776]|uniref:Vamp-like protein ykt62 n=2 Tax=Monodopsidaceae TaxID=425072 RepID=W7TQ86_9STRA|nr:vamp-like protein ykt62 [Nannochloropsis gaditana]TFJ88255.1 hypothetical protein NSK_000604 [Nannochloropsis salina CCMP1776]|eukprot:TFJ88255.1 hypothetical protein NSK_000604 [Nannochloropsis salina CCMP1776]
MKIVAIALHRYQRDTPEPIILSSVTELESFGYFQRNGIREMCRFMSKTLIKRCQPGQRQTIQHEEYNVHCHLRTDGLGGTVIADLEYPPRVAFVLLSTLLERFAVDITNWSSVTQQESVTYPPLQEAIREYQDPAKADKITKIRRDLDETTDILHKTIDAVLERGVKLDELVERSNDLSSQSKLFYKQARKTNSCCSIS